MPRLSLFALSMSSGAVMAANIPKKMIATEAIGRKLKWLPSCTLRAVVR